MNNNTNGSDLLFYLLIGVIVFFAIAIILMVIKYSNRKVKTSSNALNYNETKSNFKSAESQSNFESVSDPEITKEIVQGVGFDKLDLIQHRNNSGLEYCTSKLDTINTFCENPIAPTVFYMKYPIENSFSANFQSYSIANTIYKFYLNSNKVEATYEIHTEAVPIKEIISMVEKAIKSGCDEDNIPDSYTKKITTLTLGRVKLENNKWIIINKALIRYE